MVLAYDSYYWPPAGHGWPVSFFVVTLVFIFYLLWARARRRRLTARRAGGTATPRALDWVFSGFMVNAWTVASIVAVVAGLVGFFTVLRGSAFVAHAIPNGRSRAPPGRA